MKVLGESRDVAGRRLGEKAVVGRMLGSNDVLLSKGGVISNEQGTEGKKGADLKSVGEQSADESVDVLVRSRLEAGRDLVDNHLHRKGEERERRLENRHDLVDVLPRVPVAARGARVASWREPGRCPSRLLLAIG